MLNQVVFDFHDLEIFDEEVGGFVFNLKLLTVHGDDLQGFAFEVQTSGVGATVYKR